MTDKEEVEPSEESAPIEPSGASVDPEHSGATAADQVPVGADDLSSDDLETDETDDAQVAGEDDADEFADGDRFDQIVRDSGIDEPRDDDSTDDDTEKALEPAGVAAGLAGSSAVTTSKSGRQPKGVATQRRDQPVKAERRTGPVKFVRESVGELRKVVYPTGQQLISYFVVVLVFVLFVIGYVSLLDLGLGAAIFKIFS